jgi:hypothetical protein
LPAWRSLFARWPARSASRTIFVTVGLAALAGVATACTETPGYFPPCVNNAPCPGEDSGIDASADADAEIDAQPATADAAEAE